MEYRMEHDSMGEVRVPADKYWGAQTQRSKQNFQIGGEIMPREITHAFGILKKAAAMANYKLGKLDERRCKAIQQASHSDIAIYNRGGVRSKNHLNKGPVTIRDIYELEPFREKIVTCSMSKADIEQLILSKFMSPTDDEGGVLEVYCSGFSYQIMDGVTPSITSTLKNGVIYTVAMGDYLCSNFIFPQRGNGKPTGIDVRKALIDYLKQIKELLNPPPSKLPIIKDTTFAL